MKSWPVKYWVFLVLGLVVLVLIVLGLLYLFGDKRKTVKVKKYDLPEQGQGIPTGFNPETVASDLFNALKGSDFDDMEIVKALRKFNELTTDDMKVLAYNTFNESYQGHDENEENFTLREWVNDEYMWTSAGETQREIFNSETSRLGLA